MSSVLGLWRRSLCTGARREKGKKLRFIFDGESEVPFLYENRVGGFWFEEDYRQSFEKVYRKVCNGEGISSYGALEYTMLDPVTCVEAMERVGRTPANREIGVCTIPRAFYERKCYSVRKWRGECMGREFWYHSVSLRPRHLLNSLLKEELRNGAVWRTRFNKLKAGVTSAVIKHGVEVDLMKQHGCNFVIFLSRYEMGKRSAISRELAKLDVEVDDLKLQMWRPEEDPFYADTPREKRLLTREVQNTRRRMKQRLTMTHCRTSPRPEVDTQPVEYYEVLDSQPLFGHHYNVTSDKLVVELDTTKWERKKEAIPWQERLTAKPDGKIKEVLKIVEINDVPADIMIPKRRLQDWSDPSFGASKVKRVSRKIPEH